MRFFFKSRQFKIIVAALAAVILLSITTLIIKGFTTPQNNLFGSVIAPIQNAAAAVNNGINNLKTRLSDNSKLLKENEELKKQIALLTEDLLDYEDSVKENEFYKNYLEIKDDHTDFRFEPAMKIAADSTDIYGGFTINKGTLNGISLHDPVITYDGLVGYISEVGLSYSKVTTILSPELSVGAYDKRTRDVGAICGQLSFAEKGQTRLFNITRNCTITVGDYIVTSGGGIFPEGLIIGSVEAVEQEDSTASLYAVITPAAELDTITDLMVITYFSGQGNVSDMAEVN